MVSADHGSLCCFTPVYLNGTAFVTRMMRAEVIAIGSELTCGSRLDTNSQWLSRELEALGWTVHRHTTLSDDMAEIVEEFRAASGRSDVVIVTGGLGPTLDDITRDALADAFYQKLVTDTDSLRQIQALFAARGRDMPERNQRQALRPELAEAIPNRCGTAPGILLRVAGRTRSFQGDCNSDTDPGKLDSGTKETLFAVLPGVPAEMRPMFQEQVQPLLAESGMALHRSVIRTFGYGESDAERLLGDLTARGRNPEVGITASEAVISLSITARAPSAEECRTMSEVVRAQILERLGSAVYTEDDRELHDVTGQLLLSRGKRVAFVEGATTGGLLAHWFTEDTVRDSCMSFGRIMCILPDWRSLTEASTLMAEWEKYAHAEAQSILQSGTADFVLLSSPYITTTTSQGVILKQGQVAIAGPSLFRTFDVSMSGNLAIFRQRAARTALNQLRLHLINL